MLARVLDLPIVRFTLMTYSKSLFLFLFPSILRFRDICPTCSGKISTFCYNFSQICNNNRQLFRWPLFAFNLSLTDPDPKLFLQAGREYTR